MIRRTLIIPAALLGLLALTPTVNAAFGLLRQTGGVEVPPPPTGPGGVAPPAEENPGGISPTPSPPKTDGIAAFPPSGGIGPGNVAEPKPPKKKCRKGTHKVKRKGKVRCVKNKKKNKAGKSGRQGR